jgi:glutamate dehydrogenase
MDQITNGTRTTPSASPILAELRTELSKCVPAGERDRILRFAELFFLRAPIEFFQHRPVEALAPLTLAAYRHLERSQPDRVDVQVVNPTAEDEGWTAPVTVVRTNVSERPFIVDTIREYLHGRDLAVERFLHPVLHVDRDEGGGIRALGPVTAGEPRESIVHCEVPRVGSPDVLEEIRRDLVAALEDAVAATTDFGAMVNALNETVAYLEEAVRRFPDRRAEIMEVQEFLRWLRQGSFIFLGYRGYDLQDRPEGLTLGVEPGSGLGLLRDERQSGFARPVPLKELWPELRERVSGGPLLIISKTNAESTVHRRVRMDYIGVKKLDAEGNVVGERRFLGLFTSNAYAQDAEYIPLLREKLRTIQERSGALEGSHDYKETITIFNSMPKEELFLASAEEIGEEIEAILARYHTQEVKVTVRRDPLERGASVMVIMPKERYSGRARRALQAELVARYHGTLLNYHLVMGGGDQARLHFYIAAPAEQLRAVTAEDVEEIARRILRTWADELELRLAEQRSPDEARRAARSYGAAFGLDYQAMTSAAEAVADIARLEAMAAGDDHVALDFLNPERPTALAAGEPVTLLKVFLRGERLVLSDFMPILENVGLRVIAMTPFEVAGPDVPAAHIYVFAVQTPAGGPLELDERSHVLAATIMAVRACEACNDSLNGLVLSAGLSWRQVDVIRAFAEYAFQLKAVPSRLALPTALRSHPELAALFVRTFEAKFDPADPRSTEARQELLAALRGEFIQGLETVTSLAADRALRRLLLLLDACVRTNYFRHGGGAPTGRAGGVPFIAFKFLGEHMAAIVRTRLRAEIYVHSARVSGIHLRSDKISRGGLRHSDRPDDFRTEILGLVKTQAIKNAVIVPAGSKGGFVTRRQPTDPAEQRAEVEAQYRAFIRGLLEVTDNLVDGAIVPPPDTVAYDEPDPYLVVAADKGTAVFSDVANSVAADYAFWLDDAFASGGSNGYDHKRVGITARGAWECVRRHFREMGSDIQTEPFTVVGIGDMSGDVFGNGMLLSRQIRLLAAFDHRHIFVDPDPDPAASFAERKRLFDLGRSCWADYDAALLSAGGFIVPRGSKEVLLPPEASAALGLPDGVDRLDGESLMQAILRAPVDLLWNGGIGTYVKASDESHTDAGDSANDAIRVDATELRCRVIGEGGNLGLTQGARIEFALAGGHVYTDAIDNSGGVDMSDREVNLKILLTGAMKAGLLERASRNALLEQLTPAVTERVLADNRSQSLAVSLDDLRSPESLDDLHALTVTLERAGLLDRRADALPSLEVLTERRARGLGLTRPELSVLLAYSKLSLKQELLAGDVIDDPGLGSYLVEYFPAEAVALAGPDVLATHRLRREIIATQLGNDLVDLMGSTFLYRVARDTGAGQEEIARAWVVAARLCGARELRGRLEALEGELSTEVVYRWLLGLARVLDRTTRWVLANVAASTPIGAVVEKHAAGLAELRNSFAAIVAGGERDVFEARVAEMQELTGKGDLAQALITLRFLDQLMEILTVARETGQSPIRVGRAFYLASEMIAAPQLRIGIANAAAGGRWEQRAAQTLLDDLGNAHRRLTTAVVNAGGTDEPVEALVAKVAAEKQHRLAAFRELLEEIGADERPGLAALAIAVRALP